MKKASYFPHPQPLTPTTTAEPKQIGGRLVWVHPKKGRLKGVGTTQSIYYLWFEYLKRSEKYKKACGYEVDMTKEEKKEYASWFKQKKTKKLIGDFGNIFQYKTNAMGYTDVNDFYYKWWEKRGAELFGIQDTENELREFASYEDVVSLKSDIDDYEILLLPKVLPKTEMRKRVGKLITSIKEDADRGEADYPIVSDRVDVESLRNCLEVYDLMTDKNNELTAVEVYAEVIGIKSEHKDLDLFTDARSERGMLRDYMVKEADYVEDDDAWLKANDSADMKSEEQREAEAMTYADRKLKWREEQRVKSEFDDGKGGFYSKNTRYLSDDELGKLRELYIAKHLGILVKTPQSEERVRAKNYYKMATYRLFNKAKANIKAVEKGMFGEGHYAPNN